MKKLKRTDYIILAVLLILVIGITCLVNLKEKKKEPENAASETHDTLSDFSKKRFGILTGSCFEEVTLQEFPDAEYYYFDSSTDELTALLHDKIDAYLEDEPIARMQHNANETVDYLHDPIKKEDYYFGFGKNENKEKLLHEFNQYLAELKENGQCDELIKKWFNSDDTDNTIDASGLTGENGKVVVSVMPDNVPFAYYEQNELRGYAVELMLGFGRKYGYAIEFEQCKTSSGLAGIAAGTSDILAGSLSMTEERKEAINFSDAVYNGGIVLVARSEDLAQENADSEPETAKLTDFAEKKAGVISGSMHETIIEKHFPGSAVLEFTNYSDMTAALNSGHIDYFLMSNTGVDQLMAENDSLAYIKEPMEKIDVVAMFPKTPEGDKLRAQVDEFLTKIIADGTQAEILAYWSKEDIGSAYVDMSDLTGVNGTLVMATNATEMPDAYIADGHFAGTEIDLAVRFCREYGYALDIRSVDSAGIIPGLITGMYDFSMSSSLITDERKESINFSVPYNGDSFYLVGRKSDIILKDQSAGDGEKSFIQRILNSFEKNLIRESRWKLILEGIATTSLITALTVLFGTILAFLICLFRRTESILAEKIADFYVKLLQGTPMVVLLMILYYVVFGKAGVPAVWVAVIGFSLNFAAYVSEALRSGINGIDSGQREAALALGFSENQAFFRFIFPQAAVRQLPVYRGEIISLLKNTSIVGYIAVQDLTKMSDIIRSRTYEAFFPLIITAVIYFILAWIISLFLKLILKQIDPHTRKRTLKGVTMK